MDWLENSWGPLLNSEFDKPYFITLRRFLDDEYKNKMIYPSQDDVFNALHYTGYKETKVVILGQDPYHGLGQAHGLSFSVKPGVKIPPSLKNIFKELKDDLGYDVPNHGSLVKWAKQGVLLINTVLTVREKEPSSHKGMGWERFTDTVIKHLNQREEPIIFVFWGKHAEAKEPLITNKHHYVLKAPHPSPFSARRGFFGSKPFSQVNRILESLGNEPIDWRLKTMGNE